MTYAMDAGFRSGVRYIPVRRTEGELWLNTQWVCDTPEEAAEGARIADRHEMGPEWAAENELVAIAVVRLDILDMCAVSRRMPR